MGKTNMFGFLKKKLKEAVGAFSKKVEEEGEVEEKIVEQEVKEKQPEKKETKPKEEKPKKEDTKEETSEPKDPKSQKPTSIKETKEDSKKEQPIVEETRLEKENIKKPDMAKTEEETVIVHRAEDEKEEHVLEDDGKDPLTEELLEKEKEQELLTESLNEKARQKALEQEKEESSKPKKKGFFSSLFGKKEEKTLKEVKEEKDITQEKTPKDKEQTTKEVEKTSIPQEKPEVKETKTEKVEEEKSFFGKIKQTLTTVKISESKFEEIFWDLEIAMLENNVAVEVIEKIKQDLKEDLTTGRLAKKNVQEIILSSLKHSIEGLFLDNEVNLIKKIKDKEEKPYVIAFIGVNGSGKTTNMAKVASYLKEKGLSVVFGASDTFRAAAIDQLEEHANNLNIKMIKHDYESDPAAVAFDTIKHAKSKNIDVVMIDTAGRLHSNDNLMNELKKLIRVNNPDMKIFVGESITGNDCVEQAKLFDEAVGIDGIILSKADVDEKGGAAISVSYVTKKPILFLGNGQEYKDLEIFDKEKIIRNIGL
jgi:fused signal recognition particle receptor